MLSCLLLGLLAQADQQRSCCRKAFQKRCYANAAKQDAAVATAAEQEALVAAAEEAAIASSQRSCSHLMITQL